MVPTLTNLFGDAASTVKGVFNSVLSFLGVGGGSTGGQNEEQAQWALLQALAVAVQAIVVDMDKEAQAVHDNARTLGAIGYDIGRIGYVQWETWQRLRYKIMPDTIANMYTFIWRAGVDPLRVGLVHTMQWASGWFIWSEGFLMDLRAWTWRIQNVTRGYRAAYVYPQLLYMMSPFRFAYWNRQAITTAVADYLRDTGHAEHRDTISRAVYSDLSRLWRVADQYFAAWLETDISDFGWGSRAPIWPRDSKTPPPHRPPGVWEPWQPEPAEPQVPPYVPRIPNVNFTRGW